jgi:hypothetical protein
MMISKHLLQFRDELLVCLQQKFALATQNMIEIMLKNVALCSSTVLFFTHSYIYIQQQNMHQMKALFKRKLTKNKELQAFDGHVLINQRHFFSLNATT